MLLASFGGDGVKTVRNGGVAFMIAGGVERVVAGDEEGTNMGWRRC